MFGDFFTSPADLPIKHAGMKRSSRWPAVRLVHLLGHSTCAACGGTKSLNVHHIKPFHLYPSLELEPSNLLTLCEANGLSCHLQYGHLRSWPSYNATAVEDAAAWLQKIRGRP
jgi:5-methylcytosine-specific restriction protein A